MPKLLDLYCGQGGAAAGYYRAGFLVTGVDHLAQPRFPFKFIRSAARSYLADHSHEYDAIHLSPPCQKYSRGSRSNKKKYSDELEKVLPLISQINIPWVIENVELAPMPKTISLVGTMFKLNIIRKRIFYSNILLFEPEPVHQKKRYYPEKEIFTVAGTGNKGNTVAAWSKAMGINWMTRNGLREAIPPAYTEFIGHQLMHYITNTNPTL